MHETLMKMDKAYRLFLERINQELTGMENQDINGTQVLILYNLSKNRLPVSKIAHRAYYYGSNASYNLKKLYQKGYLIPSKSPYDSRYVTITLSPKAVELCAQFQTIFANQKTHMQQTMGQEKWEAFEKSLDQFIHEFR
jgi:DNA-binding MarR family transcriptional regulator